MVLLEICCRNQTGDKRSQPLAQSSIFIIMLFLTSPSIHCICVLPENAFHITLKNVLVCRKIQVTTTQQFLFFYNNELSRLNLTMDIIDTETDYGHYKRLKVLNVVHKKRQYLSFWSNLLVNCFIKLTNCLFCTVIIMIFASFLYLLT